MFYFVNTTIQDQVKASKLYNKNVSIIKIILIKKTKSDLLLGKLQNTKCIFEDNEKLLKCIVPMRSFETERAKHV